MNKLMIFLGIIVIMVSLQNCEKTSKNYLNETKQEFDGRMAWWRDARFGMFIHWGIYSVPAGIYKGQDGHAEWIMNTAKIPVVEYEQYASQFNPVKFNAEEWVKIAKNAGMKYMVITSKHHDGFCIWDSKVSDYDIIDRTPFKRDVLRDLADACKKEGIKFCFYHSIMDWHHHNALGENFPKYRDEYMKPQLKELLTNYGPLGVLWFDGEWIAEWTEEQGKELYNFVRNLQPDIIINNRVGKGRAGMQGMNKYQNAAGDFGTPEQEILESAAEYDWESCMTMNDHWGYASYDNNWKSTKTLLHNLIDIASKGGNYLLNVGPTSEGLIPPQSVKALKEMGQWMTVHSESIYGTQKSPFAQTPWGRSTTKKENGNTIIYLHVFGWPNNGKLTVPGLGNDPFKVSLLTVQSQTLDFSRDNENIVISIPETKPNPIASVISMEFNGDVVVYHPPKISASSDILVNSVEVSLRVPSEDLEIYYTLDGTIPSLNSLKYEKPFQIKYSTILKALSFYNEKPVSEIVEKTFVKVTPQSAVNVTNVQPGLKYEYYEGEWNTLPNFEQLKQIAIGVVDTIDLKLRKKEEKFGMRFTGYFEVDQDEVYIFSLTSDDGSQLYIDDQLIVDNDSLHGSSEKQGRVGLAKGKHSLLIVYFNKLGGKELDLKIGVIGDELKSIPTDKLFHVSNR